MKSWWKVSVFPWCDLAGCSWGCGSRGRGGDADRSPAGVQHLEQGSGPGCALLTCTTVRHELWDRMVRYHRVKLCG